MIVRLRMRYIATALAILALGLCMAYEMHARGEFYERNNEIAKNIAKNIENIDNSMTESIVNATRYLQNRMLLSGNITREELIKIKNETNVSTISLFGDDGRFYLTTGRAMDPTYEHYNFYKDTNVIFPMNRCDNKERYKTEQRMRQCRFVHNMFLDSKERPHVVKVAPLFLSLPRNIPNKLAVSYDVKLKKYLDVSYSGEHLQKILDNSIVNDDVNEITILNYGNAELIAKSSNSSNVTADKMLTLEIPFGRSRNIEGISMNGDNNTYFYLLRISFIKEKLNRHITVIRITSVVIIAIILLTLYCVSLKQNGVIDLRKKVKKK